MFLIFPRFLVCLLLPVLLCHCTLPQPAVQPDGAEGLRWTRVTRRMARSVPADERGRPVNWDFSVRAGQGTNATSWPDGRIQVTAGTLRFVKSDAELAAILAHEMAHVFCAHGRQRAMASWATLLAGAGLATALTQSGMDPGAAAAVGAGAGLTFSSTVLTAGHREQEYEADRVSLNLLRRAGYPPAGAVHFWERYAAARARHGLGKGSWRKTHPPDAARLERLRELSVSP